MWAWLPWAENFRENCTLFVRNSLSRQMWLLPEEDSSQSEPGPATETLTTGKMKLLLEDPPAGPCRKYDPWQLQLYSSCLQSEVKEDLRIWELYSCFTNICLNKTGSHELISTRYKLSPLFITAVPLLHMQLRLSAYYSGEPDLQDLPESCTIILQRSFASKSWFAYLWPLSYYSILSLWQEHQ